MCIYCIFEIIITKNIGENKLKDLSYEPLGDELEIDNFLLAENPDVPIELINAAAYVGGYLVRRLKKIHSNKSISECKFCCLLLSGQDFDLHLFCTLKEFEDYSNKEHLNYCSKEFIDLIVKWDKIFIFIMLKLNIIINSGKKYLQ